MGWNRRLMIQNRYVLYKKIARGGMAEIFLGKQVGEDGFERVCCFKRILPHFSVEKEFIEMFRDEAHIGKRLQHPNIVRVEGFEEVDGAYAIVMEFVSGGDLRSIASACKKEQRKIPVAFAVQAIAEAAKGLHYAHMKKDDITDQVLGIVHRDISPQNILLSFEGEVKVTDFGIADAESKITETKTGIVKGKFSYMSPEQIMAEKIDARTDIFALGAILWELLAGKKLFDSENEIEVIQKVRDCEINEDIREINPNVDQDLYNILLKALSKNLEDRYSSASEFEKALRLYQNQKNPGYSSEDLGELLRDLLPEKQANISAQIKEMLSSTEKTKTTFELDLNDEHEGTHSSATLTQTRSAWTATQKMSTAGSYETKSNTIQKKPETQTKIQTPRPEEPLREQTTRKGSSLKRQGTRSKNYYTARSENSSSSSKTLLILFVICLLAVAGFFAYKKIMIRSFNLSIKTLPDRTMIDVNGAPLEQGKYLTSPTALQNLSKGSYTITAKRAGFATESTQITLGNRENNEITLILRQTSKMAPLRLSFRSSTFPSVHYSLDNGLAEGVLTSSSDLNVNYVTFGEEHTLIVDLSNNSSFSCQFTPRAQSWEAPFLVLVDADQRSCSYPLR